MRGITPAGAGKTAVNYAECFICKDHPRRCGENRVTGSIGCTQAGSPPQVRGKLTKVKQGITEQRITPAGAGKTRRCPHLYSGLPDHPRRCGENFRHAVFACRNSGSPPQVRGKPFASTPDQVNARITPAGAGKTIWMSELARLDEDHPRRCGENKLPHLIYGIALGSPPQVRGKLLI